MDLPLSQVPLSPPLHSNFPLPTTPLRSSKLFSSSRLLSKQWLHRTTFFALFSLFIVSTYILLGAGPSTFQPVTYAHQADSRSPLRVAMTNLADSKKLWKASHQDILATRPQIELTPEQELAAVSSFIISLPSQNVIPSTVDPLVPIDPSLVLDFDTRADGAAAEMKQLAYEVWDTNPVVLYYKKSSSAGRELRSTLESYNLSPSPIIINLHDRHDADVLEPLLERLTSSTLPLLIVHGQVVETQTLERVKTLSQSGTLRKLVSDAGAIVDGGKRRKGKK